MFEQGKHCTKYTLVSTVFAMPTSAPPTIDPQAASRWQGLPTPASPWLHEEIAQRMQARLDYINVIPKRWLHWAPLLGGMQAHRQLLRHYPGALALVWESSPQRAAQAAGALSPPWWSPLRWRQGATKVQMDTQANAQMVWANMGLHMDPAPEHTMARWHAALEVGGFVMFSCLGPDTLKELRAVYQRLGWPIPSHAYTDMHDLGDMLGVAGFAEPVMSMESITLTFASPQRLLQELRGLGRNLHLDRFEGLRTPRWRDRLEEELARQLSSTAHDGQLALSFEIVFGHAFKPAAKLSLSSQSTVTLAQMRESLADNRLRRSEKLGAAMPDNIDR